MTVGQRIKLRRLQLGMTQNDLAQNMNTSQHQIYKYESDGNRPTSDVIRSLALTLDVSSDWLLGLSDELNPNYEESSLSYSEHELLKLYRAKPTDKQESIISMVRAI